MPRAKVVEAGAPRAVGAGSVPAPGKRITTSTFHRGGLCGRPRGLRVSARVRGRRRCSDHPLSVHPVSPCAVPRPCNFLPPSAVTRHMRAVVSLLLFTLVAGPVHAQEPFETSDPLRAFVYEQYPRGSDYFIHGYRDTKVYRCLADVNRDGRIDIALSEKSILGNRTGPFEIFVRDGGRDYNYQRTADYDSELKALCAGRIESCKLGVYLTSGQCPWRAGW
jgi:hypothetical protein